MEMNNIKKYPRSKNNFQCLGPCYYPGTKITHPITLETVTDNVDIFCPVNQWIQENSEGRKYGLLTDVCNKETMTKSYSKKELEIDMLIPYIDFNSEMFLTFYNINSFDNGINWINENKYKSLDNRIRILNMCLISYNKQINIIDNKTADIFIEIIKNKYIKKIYKQISKYINIKNDKIYLIKPNKKKEEDSILKIDNDIKKMNYIIDNFINNEELSKFLIRYIKQHDKSWNTFVNHIDDIISNLIIYITKKITTTLNN